MCSSYYDYFPPSQLILQHWEHTAACSPGTDVALVSCPQQCNSILGMSSLAKGEHPDKQKKDAQIPHPGITVSPAMVLVCCCMAHHEEYTKQNYKKTVVFQLAIGKTAGTVCSLVCHY